MRCRVLSSCGAQSEDLIAVLFGCITYVGAKLGLTVVRLQAFIISHREPRFNSCVAAEREVKEKSEKLGKPNFQEGIPLAYGRGLGVEPRSGDFTEWPTVCPTSALVVAVRVQPAPEPNTAFRFSVHASSRNMEPELNPEPKAPEATLDAIEETRFFIPEKAELYSGSNPFERRTEPERRFRVGVWALAEPNTAFEFGVRGNVP
ncbi:hypothetical protein C8F04DRAFT_1191784 [Mycena alexandri]|uniref:Uncharacterized protein n=1 Tax=Mycena alexandri TaxID=1745969 RepID=A0AAD6SE62_9AGAR|nr:hypothetical protein C8F04DRAFT_1191784 [Mycena alexandri]